MRKKVVIILVSIFAFSLLSAIGIKCFHKEDIKQDSLSNIEEKSSKKNDNEEKSDIITDKSNQNEIEKSKEEKVTEQENKADNKVESDVPKKSTTSSSTTTSNIKSNNQNENIQKNENLIQESPKQESPQPVVPSCTPKKFDMNFVRADFSSFESCTQMGDKYKEVGYGYFCDNYQDDCGTTYYMLTIYERNTGTEYDFHTIQLP